MIRLRSRRALLGMALGVAAMLASSLAKPSVRLAFNPSASAPRGWYEIAPTEPFQMGDFVVIRLPHDTARFADVRGYLPSSVPVLKQIVATAGQQVCMVGGQVYVDEVWLAKALDKDGQGRPMPKWNQCRRLIADELFLLNTSNPASFDSRYFGPIDASFVIGRATPLWIFGS